MLLGKRPTLWASGKKERRLTSVIWTPGEGPAAAQNSRSSTAPTDTWHRPVGELEDGFAAFPKCVPVAQHTCHPTCATKAMLYRWAFRVMWFGRISGARPSAWAPDMTLQALLKRLRPASSPSRYSGSWKLSFSSYVIETKWKQKIRGTELRNIFVFGSETCLIPIINGQRPRGLHLSCYIAQMGI